MEKLILLFLDLMLISCGDKDDEDSGDFFSNLTRTLYLQLVQEFLC